MSAFDEIEHLAATDFGRNIGVLAEAVRGGMSQASTSIAESDGPIILITGVCIAWALTNAAETDGPPGSVMLGRLLREAGREVVVVTDSACEPVVRALTGDAGLDLIVPQSAADVDRLGVEFGISSGQTHLVSIERLGPAADGRSYFMNGLVANDRLDHVSRLFANTNATTIAIGDGGNELGMGTLDRGLIASSVGHGDRVACVVPCDHLIVAGISNLGAAGLALSIAMRMPEIRDLALGVVTAAEHERLVRLAVDGGAVDGLTGEPDLLVDGIELDACGEIIKAMGEVLVPWSGRS